MSLFECSPHARTCSYRLINSGKQVTPLTPLTPELGAGGVRGVICFSSKTTIYRTGSLPVIVGSLPVIVGSLPTNVKSLPVAKATIYARVYR